MRADTGEGGRDPSGRGMCEGEGGGGHEYSGVARKDGGTLEGKLDNGRGC